MSPLSSKSVLITRPYGEEFAEMLVSRGAQACCHPVIQILDPVHWDEVDRTLAQLSNFDWIVFASANGVDRFLSRLNLHSDRRRLQTCQIAAIGNQTAQRLVRQGIPVSLIPPRNNSEAMADALITQSPIGSVLLVRGDRGSSTLSERLTKAGIQFVEIYCYRTVNVEVSVPEVRGQLKQGYFDWVTITSSAIAEAAVALWPRELLKTKLVSISPTTTAKLLDLGYAPAAEAQAYDMIGIIEAMESWEDQNA